MTMNARSTWKEGGISFMSDAEYEKLCLVNNRNAVAMTVLSSANEADAAIKKAMRK